MTDTIFYTALVSLSYLAGSIPMGLVLGRIFGVGDIRKIGSGNIGATNALRTGNKSFAIAVLAGDALKAVIPILIAKYCLTESYPHAPVIAGLAALIGHVFPVWLKFKGGKGVASSAGILLTLHWPTGVACLVMWLFCARLSRISSLSAIIAAVNLPVYAIATGGREYAVPFAVVAALVIFTHRENIKRLLKGEESTINLKKEA